MIEKDIKVSVHCLVYNHEKYLKKCLDGFVMQKTNFKFEVLIHNDASTDNSADIIREYEQKYPEIIKPIYQTENQYSKKVNIFKTFQLPRAKGKYIAFCEGDDYWCDEYKLQKQFDFMESHPECSICSHRTLVFNNKTGEKIGLMPKKKIKVKNVYMLEDYFKYGHFIHTSSYFIRKNILAEYHETNPKFKQICPVGDIPMALWCGAHGNIGYINDVMSCYRYNAGGWSTTVLKDPKIKKDGALKMISVYEEFDLLTEYKYHKQIVKVQKDNAIKENLSYEKLNMVDKIHQKLFQVKKYIVNFIKKRLYFLVKFWHKIHT